MTTNKTDSCDVLELKQLSILDDILEKFSIQNDLQFSLDLQEFNHACYKINNILLDHNYFLQVFEQKNNYRQFLLKKKQKNKTKSSNCQVVLLKNTTDFKFSK